MSKAIARLLLEKKAVALRPKEPFTWASGIKSPIYCDNRLLLSFVDARNEIVDAFCSLIANKYANTTMILGTATAGIPWAALIAQKLNVKMGYVRGKQKDHGKQNKIEGRIEEGDQIIIIEDLISTGGSVCDVIKTVQSLDVTLLATVAIFTYLLHDAKKTFETCKCTLETLTNYDELIEEASNLNYIEKNDLEKLYEWRKDPHHEEWMLK